MNHAVTRFLFFWCCLLALQPAHALLKQEVQISNVAILNPVNHNGATCLPIKFAAQFKYTARDKEKDKDSSDNNYSVEMRFETEAGLILAEDGYTKFTDSGNVVKLDAHIAVYEAKYYPNNETMIPLSAFKLDSGNYKLRIVFRVFDKEHNLVSQYFATPFTKFHMPPKLALKIMVREIDVAHTDPAGYSWDFTVFDYKASLPDVMWIVESGGTTINVSATLMNTFTWMDSLGRNDFVLHIVAGDIFDIRIMDRDLLTPDDFIGSFDVDTHTVASFSSNSQQRKFNSVLNMNYAISTDLSASIPPAPPFLSIDSTTTPLK